MRYEEILSLFDHYFISIEKKTKFLEAKNASNQKTYGPV